jgi:hypothetical protein
VPIGAALAAPDAPAHLRYVLPMVPEVLAHSRVAVVVCGQALALVLLALDARREWSAYGLVLLLLTLGALAAIPAALVGSPRFRPAALVALAAGAGTVALALHDTADKRALWVYAVSALVAVALPAGRPRLGRVAGRTSARS